MQDIRTYLDLLESKGIANRKPGDTFVNDNGDEIYFRQIKFYPNNGQYSAEELTLAIEEVREELAGVDIIWTNSAPKTGGFALAEFETSSGQPLFYGRYFQNIRSPAYDNKWDNNSLPGFRYAGKASQKVQAGYMPQDVLSDLENQTADGIVNQIIQHYGADHTFSQIAVSILNGEKFPITAKKTDDIVFAGFRDYFCEILQPVALQKGLFTGNAREAEQQFLGDQGFDTCTISYGQNKTQGLSDSVMTNPNGIEIRISSKGATGAAASVSNLLTVVDELRAAGKTELLSQHQKAVEIIEMVKKYGQHLSPVALAVKLGVITTEEADTVKLVRDLSVKGQLSFQALFDSDLLSDNLKKIYQSRATADTGKANAYYHLLAGIAYKVSDQINQKGDFNQAACDLLNSGSLIQVYTRAKETADTVSITGFETVYPSKAVTGVLFWPAKSYYSTDIKGNFTFKILRNGAKDISTPGDAVISAKLDIGDPDFDQVRSSITAKSPSGRDFTEPVTDKTILGRTRRK